MKKSLLFFAMVLVAGFANAQYYSLSATDIGINPGAINQDQEQTSGYMTANYTGYTQLLAPGSSAWSADQTIPFNFEFNGQAVSSFAVSPYGVLTFTSSPSATIDDNNVALPTSTLPDNSVCVWGLNLSGGNDAVITKTFGEAPRRQQWIIWASASYTGLAGWTYWGIVLEESTNHIYVADMRTYDTGGGNATLTVGVQIDSTEAYSLANSPSVGSNATNGGSADLAFDNTYYLFGYGTQPTSDIDNISVDNFYYVTVNEATTISGTIVNHGSLPITSAQMSYSIDGGTAVTENLVGLNIAPGALDQYSFTTTWTPGDLGAAVIQTTAIQSNASNETITVNDTTDMEVLVTPTPLPRKPLLEQFTSSTCPPCVQGNLNVQSVIANYPGEFSKVNYQMSWPGNGDPYYTEEGGERRTFYGVNSVPSMHTDGSAGINSQSFTSTIFEEAQNVPAFVNLGVTGTIQAEYTYEVQGGQLVKVDSVYHLNAAVDINPIMDMPAGLVAHLAVNEVLTFNNEETNGETEFHDVMKKLLPDASGTTLAAITANDSASITESHTFPGVYRLPNDANDPVDHSVENTIEEWDDLMLVTWVQDPNTGEVWQSENAEVEVLASISNVTTDTVDGQVVYTVDGESYVMFGDDLAPLGTDESIADMISVYPNPANEMIRIDGVTGTSSVTLMDAAGRVVMNVTTDQNVVDVHAVEAGLYTISIVNNGVQKVEKVTIVH